MNAERRPEAASESAGGLDNTASVATATLEAADYNGDGAWLLHARCPFCQRTHRHAWQPRDPELATVERDAVCGAGRYVLVGLERVIP